MDQISPQRRSAVMARIKGKNTGPEVKVRQIIHSLGLRFRLHRKDLPGKPDIVLPRWGIALFVHGCFWHQHEGCSRASKPKSNVDYWRAKLSRNVERDAGLVPRLEKMGWRVVVVWECEISDAKSFSDSLFERITGSSPF